jgi:thymidylate kinase
MLIIIEGVNGAGKTTLAKSLSEGYGIPIFKPFRTDHSIHWGQSSPLEMALKAFGVPVNTHVEDFFIADFLATYPETVEAILDRGMPSAVAYGLANGEIKSASVGEAMLDWWFDQLAARHDVFYIYLGCSEEAARQRAGDRAQWGERLAAIDAALQYAWTKAKGSGFRAARIDTTAMTPERLLEFVRDWMK